MKQILWVLVLGIGVLWGQKKISIVITGYNQTEANWETASINFSDTSYYQINQQEWDNSVFGTANSVYARYGEETHPLLKGQYEVIQFHFYTDSYGTDDYYNTHQIIFYLAKKKLLSLGKL